VYSNISPIVKLDTSFGLLSEAAFDAATAAAAAAVDVRNGFASDEDDDEEDEDEMSACTGAGRLLLLLPLLELLLKCEGGGAVNEAALRIAGCGRRPPAVVQAERA
jgi:hypothetical protein